MDDGRILILKGHEISALLAGRERELMQTVRAAYEAHADGESSLPHSAFLRFPGDERNRIIALPAYLGQDFDVAGIKWIASFPGNLGRGFARASGILILNSPQTGHPEAIMEGSIISAKRTAASAALAAQSLMDGATDIRLGVLGCGLINLEIARFLMASFSGISGLSVFDLDGKRAEDYARRCRAEFDGIRVEVAGDVKSLLRTSRLVSIATTATRPHIFELSGCAPGTVILHLSLRDLSPEVVLSCDNIVDDIEHVCRAQTSVHLAEQLVGHRGFIRCALADILQQRAPAQIDAESVVVFSPFGLGVLDIAVGKFALEEALKRGLGTVIESFLPEQAAAGL